ncbi:hypothetical protein AVL62_15120 [Serinicoccus chungangensis]|uniref:Aminoglycoside phosphotransferase domain-containing protein n=2 Tax=Serinicoccus chungangensis TaxID=767452 RepID=A0A0W8IAX2_9MICO|nr:hypothetical protein AVL62_15120 [Serinicoccus chungangensis]
MSWNGDRLALWDFERFDVDGLVGLDAVHYAVSTVSRGRTPTFDVVLAGIDLARRSFVNDGTDVDALVTAYLAAISLRYLERSTGLRGELIAPRAELMLGALQRWLDMPQAAAGLG